MARKALISKYDWGQEPGVTVVGGSWEANFGAENMLKPQIQQVAQAVGTSVSFTVSLASTRTIGLIHVQRLFTAGTGTIRVRAGVYDSGTVSSWPADAAGQYSSLLYMALGRPRVFIPTTPVSASSVTFDIDAVTAPLQIGYVGIVEILETPNDILVSTTTKVVDEASTQYTPNGSRYTTFRGKRRIIDFALPPLPDANVSTDGYTDSFKEVFDLALINGKSYPMVVVKFPDDIENLERNTIAGVVSNDVPFTNRFYGYHDTTFQITQDI